jgi:hippurate hydrolase
MPVKNRLAELWPEITAWRRDFHAHPELLFEVHRTAGIVAARLRAFGCDEVVTGIGRTGVVGVIRGRTDTQGRVVALRADMDALPIAEATGAPHASMVPGVMHACGHDGHSAMLLGAAQYLCETRAFDGTAVVVFQPAEEGGGGGREMCEAGLMARWNIQEIYGMHNMPGLPLGEFAIRPGPFFAATDQFTIDVTGRGGHAAKPHETIDPIVAAAQMVLALQTIVSRNTDPLQNVVVSVTALRSSSEAYNVIPRMVQLRGTLRTLEAEMRTMAEARLRSIVAHVAEAFGATAAVDWQRGYPVMVNHPAETAHAAAVATAVSGRPVREVPPLMVGEDFAYMLEERPGAYILIGNGDTAGVHHPAYDFDDAVIPAGASWLAGMIEARMPAV